MLKNIKKKIFILLVALTFSTEMFSQTSVSGGADFVSRYVWRGIDFGNSFSVQPSLSVSNGGFEAGFWGSYPFVNDNMGAEEMDLYLGYSISDFSVLVTDYYFPTSGGKYGNYKDPGSHTIEIGLSYGGSDSFPISLAAYMNVYNDEDNTVYFEVGYSTEIQEVGFDLFVGGTPGGDGAYYGTTEFNLINIGITASKEISITDDFSLPIFSSYVLNPNLEIGHLIFGLSLGM
ncbi:MAG: hypothetical protein KDC88_08490 [Ignavibacteriae bacterium]|nr:hypothetical protein [Ignavibacteriota bacterium]MCB9208521.1 hypothetical protein [Ignavibacteriales bacterium]MCB9258370.1 hypothetical protein [Ignavibacteriales bacterium]